MTDVTLEKCCQLIQLYEPSAEARANNQLLLDGELLSNRTVTLDTLTYGTKVQCLGSFKSPAVLVDTHTHTHKCVAGCLDTRQLSQSIVR